jgi:3-oxoacyl-[acyl-carrier-protein] synthase-1
MSARLSALGVVCALGASKEEVLSAALARSVDGMLPVEGVVPNKSPFFGTVTHAMPEADTRTNALLLCAYNQIKEDVERLKAKYGADRIGIVIGSSNTGMNEGEKAIAKWIDSGARPKEFSFSQLDLSAPAKFLQNVAGLNNVAYVISTACSSSAKAFSSARRLLDRDICDVALVGGADGGACSFALNGFNSLEALSKTISNPCSKNRDGINIGEGAALFIMERGEDGIVMLGAGETSDAYHMTAPDPNALGAIAAMREALSDAGLNPEDIDYVNMHGTGTAHNDAMETLAINTVFGCKTLCSSTKPMTGHTLGASGAIELALCWLTLSDLNDRRGVLPHRYDGEYDEAISPIALAKKGECANVKTILSNSFAFGGNNSSVILGIR